MSKHVHYNKDTKCWQLDYMKQIYQSYIYKRRGWKNGHSPISRCIHTPE